MTLYGTIEEGDDLIADLGRRNDWRRCTIMMTVRWAVPIEGGIYVAWRARCFARVLPALTLPVCP